MVSAPQISQADMHYDGHLVQLSTSGVNSFVTSSSLPGGTYAYQLNLTSRYNFTVTSLDYRSSSSTTYIPISDAHFFASNDTLIFSFTSSVNNQYYFHMNWSGHNRTGTVDFTVST